MILEPKNAYIVVNFILYKPGTYRTVQMHQ